MTKKSYNFVLALIVVFFTSVFYTPSVEAGIYSKVKKIGTKISQLWHKPSAKAETQSKVNEIGSKIYQLNDDRTSARLPEGVLAEREEQIVKLIDEVFQHRSNGNSNPVKVFNESFSVRQTLSNGLRTDA